MKITHVAEIVNITHVARILEAEICGAENVRAILMYNQSSDKPFVESNIDTKFKYIGTCTYFQCIVRGLSAVHAGVILYLCSSTRNCHSIIR